MKEEPGDTYGNDIQGVSTHTKKKQQKGSPSNAGSSGRGNNQYNIIKSAISSFVEKVVILVAGKEYGKMEQFYYALSYVYFCHKQDIGEFVADASHKGIKPKDMFERMVTEKQHIRFITTFYFDVFRCICYQIRLSTSATLTLSSNLTSVGDLLNPIMPLTDDDLGHIPPIMMMDTVFKAVTCEASRFEMLTKERARREGKVRPTVTFGDIYVRNDIYPTLDPLKTLVSNYKKTHNIKDQTKATKKEREEKQAM